MWKHLALLENDSSHKHTICAVVFTVPNVWVKLGVNSILVACLGW